MITIAYLSKSNQVRGNKSRKKQARKKKIPTPVPIGEHKCFACGKTKYLEIHHVYPGVNRTNSSIYKCVEWACNTHHRSQPDGVHGGNYDLDQMLKKKWQLKLMNTVMSMEDFIRIFGKNYC